MRPRPPSQHYAVLIRVTVPAAQAVLRSKEPLLTTCACGALTVSGASSFSPQHVFSIPHPWTGGVPTSKCTASRAAASAPCQARNGRVGCSCAGGGRWGEKRGPTTTITIAIVTAIMFTVGLLHTVSCFVNGARNNPVPRCPVAHVTVRAAPFRGGRTRRPSTWLAELRRPVEFLQEQRWHCTIAIVSGCLCFILTAREGAASTLLHPVPTPSRSLQMPY